MSKKGIMAVMIFCTIMVFLGFTIVTAGLPKYIKDKSDFKISYTLCPFDFTADMGEYSLCLNNKIFYNFEKGSKKVINVVGERIHSETSSIANKTEEVFKNIEGKITK